ncbi:MAG: multi-sensor signal transduction histidine kinase [Deltaproteobacteria bacterium]|nr:multi-sensor signal transduction histidine kinase [Deltaproteobacteria bacterium]
MTLYTKILLFFISLIILLSIVTTYSGIRSIEHIAVNELDKGLNSDINLFSFAVDREFYHIESRMALFSLRNVLNTAVAQRDKGKIRELLGERLRAENIDIIHITDDKNRPIITLTKDMVQTPVVFPAMNRDAVSRGFVSISSGTQEFAAMYVSMPLRAQKAILSEFFILDDRNFLVKNLSDLLSQKREEPVYVSIFKNDTRMFSTIFAVTGEQTQKLPEQITAALYRERRSYIGKTLIGRSRYYTIYKPSPYNTDRSEKWSYGIAVSENIFLPFKKKLLFVFITISILATSAVIIITFLITRGIKPSLESILNACWGIEKGHTDSRVDEKKIKIREFGLIASSINKMSAAVSERTETIKDNIRKISAINAELEEKTAIIRLDRMRFLSILETLNEGVVAIDREGIIIYCNQAAATMMGTDPAGVIGSNYHEAFPSLRVTGNDHAAVHEFVIGRKDSDEALYLKVFASPWSLENAPPGHILVLQDISTEKKIEEFKADFVSSVNHDIKSFLVPVSGFLKRILLGKYGVVEAALKEKLTDIDDNVTKIQHLVENYLNVSKIESGKIEFAIRPVDINEIIRDTVNIYPRVRFSDQGHLLALADKDYIERVIINLVANALKFSPDDAEVTISTKVESDMVVVSVADRGIGIPQKEIPLIFQRYNRGTLGMKKEGAGLGLFIVKSVIESHGGAIWVESTPGKGSVFSFSLPLFQGEI